MEGSFVGLLIRYPFSENNSVLIRGPSNKKGKRVLPRNLGGHVIGFLHGGANRAPAAVWCAVWA